MSDDPQQDEDAELTQARPAGPTDHGGKGGMGTREVAPEIAEPGGQTPSD